MKTIALITILLIQNSYSEEIQPFAAAVEDTQDTLVLLHVLFRHGNRTTDKGEFYPTDPYRTETFFPYGNGQLTKAGKLKEFSIGTSLRQAYNKFLGPYFYPNIGDFWSTDTNRTKMSLELVLASLFVPSFQEIWNLDLNWQPVPYNYKIQSEDKVLSGTSCPNYQYLYNQNSQSAKQQKEYNKYLTTFKYLSDNTGISVSSFQDVYRLFFALTTEKDWGFELPEWTTSVFPNPISEIAAKQYGVATATTPLKQMASGYLLRKIINDTETKIVNIEKQNGKRIYLYSAHEINVGHMLELLGLFTKPQVPNYGSYIVFEIHYIKKVYGIKIFYQNYSKGEPELLKLPGCATFCPLDKFTKIVEEYIPTDELCYANPQN